MDIVDRIRKKADDDEARLGFWNPVITQAADEIVELRAQLERVTAERDDANARIGTLTARCDVLARQDAEAKLDRNQARKEVAAMEAAALDLATIADVPAIGLTRANGIVYAGRAVLDALKKARGDGTV